MAGFRFFFRRLMTTTTPLSGAADASQPDASPAVPSPKGGSAPRRGRGGRTQPTRTRAAARPRHPVLEQLATRHPKLFGAAPLPLKRGIFQNLRTALPELGEEDLKEALAEHTRSTRYLQAVAAGQSRRDLDLQVVEPMAAEHVFHALVELFRRKQRKAARSPEAERATLQDEARQWLGRRLQQHIETTGLSAADYAGTMRTRDGEVQALLQELVAQASAQSARDEAMLRAFEASGASVAAFAEMYGLSVQEAGLILARARLHQQPAPDEPSHPADEAAPAVAGNDAADDAGKTS